MPNGHYPEDHRQAKEWSPERVAKLMRSAVELFILLTIGCGVAALFPGMCFSGKPDTAAAHFWMWFGVLLLFVVLPVAVRGWRRAERGLRVAPEWPLGLLVVGIGVALVLIPTIIQVDLLSHAVSCSVGRQ
jgi:hypothetical protein